MHFCVLQKFPRRDARAKFRLGKEMIIFAVDFAGARRARRAGNGVDEVRRLAERVAKRRLAGAGWRGDNKQNSVARELLTQGSGFVRGFFPARPLQATTCCEIAASFDFRAERIQFAKNFLSNEFEGAADRFVLAQMMRELREMTFEPGQFFGNVGAIGEERNFLEQALVIDRKIESGLVDALEQASRYFSPRSDRAREPPSTRSATF